jgi:hypothetical protein
MVADLEFLEARAQGDPILARKMGRIRQLVHTFCPQLDQSFWDIVRRSRTPLGGGAGPLLLEHCVVHLEKANCTPGFAQNGKVLTIRTERFEKLNVSLRTLDLDPILRHSGENGAVPSYAMGTSKDVKGPLLCILGCRITDPQVAPGLVREIESKRNTSVPIQLDFAVDAVRLEGVGTIYIQLREGEKRGRESFLRTRSANGQKGNGQKGTGVVPSDVSRLDGNSTGEVIGGEGKGDIVIYEESRMSPFFRLPQIID